MAELGERVANLEARLDAQSQDLAEIRESITHLDHRMEVRFASIDTRFVQMDARFLQVEARLDNGFRDIREEIHSNFRWIMGGIGGAVLALLLALLSAVLVWAPRA